MRDTALYLSDPLYERRETLVLGSTFAEGSHVFREPRKTWPGNQRGVSACRTRDAEA